MIEEELKEIKKSISELARLVKSNLMREEKSIYDLKELPFSKVTAYRYEKLGLLKITRPNGKNGRSFVRAEDLDAFYKGGGK